MDALPDIERWNPSEWDDCVGNGYLKRHFQDQLYALRTGRILKGVNTYIKGPSRTGKTSIARLFARCMMCENLDMTSLNPCNACVPCTEGLDRFGDQGVFAAAAGREVNFLPVDCMQLTGAEHLRELVNQMVDYNGIKVVLLDEMLRLAKRGMDEILLGPLSKLNYMWIATSIESDQIDQAVYERFPSKFTTALPSDEELAKLLMRLCHRWKIGYDAVETLILLSQVSNRVTGIALHALTEVNIKRPEYRILTRETVEMFRDRRAK